MKVCNSNISINCSTCFFKFSTEILVQKVFRWCGVVTWLCYVIMVVSYPQYMVRALSLWVLVTGLQLEAVIGERFEINWVGLLIILNCWQILGKNCDDCLMGLEDHASEGKIVMTG